MNIAHVAYGSHIEYRTCLIWESFYTAHMSHMGVTAHAWEIACWVTWLEAGAAMWDGWEGCIPSLDWLGRLAGFPRQLVITILYLYIYIYNYL